MANFPTPLTVFPAAEFRNFGQQVTADGNMGAVACILLNYDNTAAALNKICVFGPATVALAVNASTLVRIPEAEGVLLQSTVAGPEASPAPNRSTSTWFDLYEMIRQKKIMTVDDQLNQIPAEEFRAALAAQNRDGTPVCGASVRWAVGVNSEKKLRLELQYLPAPLHTVLQSGLDRDDAPGVVWAFLDLQVDMFDGVTHAGFVLYINNYLVIRKFRVQIAFLPVGLQIIVFSLFYRKQNKSFSSFFTGKPILPVPVAVTSHFRCF